MAYNENTNWANEEKYLNSLISGGGGNAVWAQNQLSNLNQAKQQYATSTPSTPSTPSYSAPSTVGSSSSSSSGGGYTYDFGGSTSIAPVNVYALGNTAQGQQIVATQLPGGGTYKDGYYTPKGSTQSYMVADGSIYTGPSGVTTDHPAYKEYLDNLAASGSSSSGYNTNNSSAIGNTFDGWREAYVNSLIAELTSQYNTNVSDLEQAYNTSTLSGERQKDQVNAGYEDSVRQLNDSTYNQYLMAQQRASSLGLTSSQLGQSALNSVMSQSSQARAGLDTSKNTLINDISRELNTLATNYNLDKNRLTQNFGQDKLAAMSQAQLEAIKMELDLAKYNTDWENQFKLQDMKNQFTSSESALDRDFSAKESAANRDMQKYLAQLGYDYQDEWNKLDAATKVQVAGISTNAQTTAAAMQLAHTAKVYGEAVYFDHIAGMLEGMQTQFGSDVPASFTVEAISSAMEYLSQYGAEQGVQMFANKMNDYIVNNGGKSSVGDLLNYTRKFGGSGGKF